MKEKKAYTILIFYVILSLLAGCETVAGSARGAQKDLEPVTGTVKKEVQKLQKTDDQMQKTLW